MTNRHGHFRFAPALFSLAFLLVGAQMNARAQAAPKEKWTEGKGSFPYTDTLVNPGKPLTVWTFFAA